MSQRRLWVFILLKNDEHTLCGYVVRAYSAFFDLSQETVPRALSGKFLHGESCYLESFGILCLWFPVSQVLRNILSVQYALLTLH